MLNNEMVYRIGDKLKASEQYPDFHKGTSYPITGIYHKDYEPVIVLKNKYGEETYITKEFEPLNSFWDKNQDLRERDMRIRTFWYLGGIVEVTYRKKGVDTTHFYQVDVGGCYVSSLGGDYYYVSVEKLKNYEPGKHYSDGKKHWFKKDEIEKFVEFFTKIIGVYDYSRVTIAPASQYKIDENLWFRMFDIKELPENIPPQKDKIPFPKNKEELYPYVAEMFFDKESLGNEEKNMLIDIIEIFYELPKSHGASSAAKVLLGTSKFKSSKVNDYRGKYKKRLKHAQMFELASTIESYLYHHKVFEWVDAYDMKDDNEGHLGAFEYIGSKKVDSAKLNAIKNDLKVS